MVTNGTTGSSTDDNGGGGNVGGDAGVVIGPDINGSRSPYDKKLYRHITLPNGLQALLIQDTIAMQQQIAMGGCGQEDGYDDDDDEEEEEEEEEDDDELDGKDDDDDDEDDEGEENGENDEDDGEEEEDDDDDGDGNVIRDAACSIVVGVGSVSDDTIHGMAHFCEHLLFMGSTKFPNENEYSSYVSKYGGNDNAYTEWEYTIYNVEIPNVNLWGAIDRLAQFFISPLLLSDAVQRELNSIESEFVLQQNIDTTRRQQLLCSTCRIDHPICKFSWGNTRSIQTIPTKQGIDPMLALHKFYNDNYYAHNVRVVIQGAYTLDQLQEGVMTYFSDVPPYPRPTTTTTTDDDDEAKNKRNEPSFVHPQKQQQMMLNAGFPFRQNILGTITRIVPVKESHSLTITWQLPSQIPNWKSKPMDYISHLLGHEASGSILSHVRQQSWATASLAGFSDDGSANATSHALFSITFTLSTHGVTMWPSVVVAIYEYIGMLRKQCEIGWPSWIYDEIYQIHALSYKYGDETSPDETVDHFAGEMSPHNHSLPIERILDGNALFFEFDETIVSSILNEYMKPELGRIDLTSSIFGTPNDFDTTTTTSDVDCNDTVVTNLIVGEADNEELNITDGSFDVSKAGIPQIDPMFGTQFWCHKLHTTYMNQLIDAADPEVPLTIHMLHLPPQNPYIPQNFDIKSLPIDDCDHPLLNAAIKLCISVGKTKQWFPATIVQYNQKMNRVLCSYEDEDEKWHALDHDVNEFNDELLCRYDTFEGTMDEKAIKFRIVAIPLSPGMKGAGLRKFGDVTDYDVDDGIQFPPIPSPSKHLPIEISNSNLLKMWWLQDRKFKRPVTEFRIHITCPAIVLEQPFHRACTDLLRKLCADALMETVYLAEMCELECQMDATDTGFYFRFDGFDDKLLDLLTTAMTLFLSFTKITDALPESIDTDRFDVCLEILQRQYKNSGNTSSSLSNGLRLCAIRPTIYSSSQKLKSLDGITISTFCQTISSIFQSFSVEAFIHGNVARDDANKARDTLLKLVSTVNSTGLSRKQYPPQSVLRIPNVLTASHIIVPSFNPSELNTSCDVYIQVGKDNVRDRVILDLIMQMMYNPMYDQIRTQDQFGYDVYCSGRWTFGILGCVFHVTTNVKSAVEVLERIDKFITDFRVDLVKMNTKDFHEHLVGLAKQKLEMYNGLSEETDCLWSEIDCGRFEWEAWRSETVCLKDISKNDVLKGLDDWLLPGKKRNILAVQVIGSGVTDASSGRPFIENDATVKDYADEQIQEFHALCKNQIWGRINSKLF